MPIEERFGIYRSSGRPGGRTRAGGPPYWDRI